MTDEHSVRRVGLPAPAVEPPTYSEITPEGLYEKCMAVAHNLWWSWQPEVHDLFRDLDPVRWRQVDHNPIVLLREITPDELHQRAGELVLYTRINQAYRRLKSYTSSRANTWGAQNAGILGSKPVAYFSVEFGIHESLPNYSDSLGISGGDHIKSASDLGVPLVAIGLFYDQGYFRQRLNNEGYQEEEYVQTKVEDLPMEPAKNAKGKPITVSIETREGVLMAKLWLMHVGRVNLYLLDCDVEGNKPQDRELTSHLYGGDQRTRIRQELVLGIGGVRALRALGITPGVYHLNEGHSAFAPLEVIRQRMHDEGLSFENALREVQQVTVFTTRTAVPDFHDRFDGSLIEEHLGPLRDKIGISHEQLMGLGRVEPQNEGELFCMTVIGLMLSRRSNAVSSLHGHVSRRMWCHLWPRRLEEEVPIGHITNGVHVPTWLAYEMRMLYDRYFGEDWQVRMDDPQVWQRIYGVDSGELWEIHNALKSVLIEFVRRRMSRQCRRRGEREEAVDAARRVLNPRALTIGFARRFATYKRADLFLRKLDRIAALINDPERPVQFIFSGKAHPADEPGKQLIRRIANLRHDPQFAGRIVFVEDYDINVGRHLVQGVDLWLNNTLRPLEASGTSGQKVVLNGGLNCSVLDGWWAEAFNGGNGFAIGAGHQHVNDELNDARDADDMMDVLEQHVIPLFYDRDIDGLPQQWIDRMKNSIATLAAPVSAQRMVVEYAQRSYLPTAVRTTEAVYPTDFIRSGQLPMKIPTELQESLKQFRHDHPDPMKVAFIVMQFGATKAHDRITQAVKAALASADIAGVRADDKWYHDDLYWNVMTYLYGCGCAVAIFERIERDDFNPNVSLEVGYMFALGKPTCLLKDKTLRSLPTDLVGKLYREFDPQNPHATIKAELGRWLRDRNIT